MIVTSRNSAARCGGVPCGKSKQTRYGLVVPWPVVPPCGAGVAGAAGCSGAGAGAGAVLWGCVVVLPSGWLGVAGCSGVTGAAGGVAGCSVVVFVVGAGVLELPPHMYLKRR